MAGDLNNIKRFVVLMLENRSFDHLLGFLKATNPGVQGLGDLEYSNFADPENPASQEVYASTPAELAMPFDPPHEFCDVQKQLYGTDPAGLCGAGPRVSPAPMTGFLFCGIATADAPNSTAAGQGRRVMECFADGQVPNITKLAQEFALFNFWYSSLPGPTWPNRFFVHAATSGGLSDSPGTEAIVLGYSFKSDTIYESLAKAGKDWRIYHDGLPQTAGIDSLRWEYINPFTKSFRTYDHFKQDVKDGILPEYTFIEPRYGGFLDTQFAKGNSMHPQDDVRDGDALVKDVYEIIRNSQYWNDTMLVITFDEHGGFYDHVSPPAAVPTGDDARYANAADKFGFDLYGVRVPAIVVSAFTSKGTIIGQDPGEKTTMFDHASILATVNKRFGLAPLTGRDKFANTLDVALNLDSPRLDAPANL